MWKDSENAKLPKMAIRHINVQNAARENMFPSPVNADYVHLAGQKQQTNGQMKSIISF